MVLGLIIVLILANFLSPNDYGNYKYVYSMVGILGVLSLSGGVRTTIIQSAAMGYDGILEVLHKKNPLLNAPMMFGAIVLGGYYIFQDNWLIGISVPILTLATIIANNGLLASAYLNGKSLQKELALFQVGIGSVNLIGLSLAVVLTSNVPLIITIASSTVAVASTWSYFYVKRRFVRNTTVDEKIAHYGKHLGLLSIFTTIQQHIDSVLIFSTLGSGALATYAIATPLVDRILGFIKSSYFLVLPKFSEWGPSASMEKIYTRTVVSFSLGLIVWLFYFFCAPTVFGVMFPQYLSAVSLSILFALNIPLAAAVMIPHAYVDSLVEIRNKYILNGAIFFTRITTLPIGLYWLGVSGVIYSELLTRFVGLCILIFIVEKQRKKLRAI
jgi:O-antigen/teichoic acid export membrane protein